MGGEDSSPPQPFEFVAVILGLPQSSLSLDMIGKLTVGCGIVKMTAVDSKWL